MYQMAVDPTFEPMFSIQQSPLGQLEDVREPPSERDVHTQRSLENEKLDKSCEVMVNCPYSLSV